MMQEDVRVLTKPRTALCHGLAR